MKVKIKLIEIDPFNESLDRFEKRVNDFMEDKNVIDVKFAIPTDRGLVCEQRFHTVMVMYKEYSEEYEEWREE